MPLFYLKSMFHHLHVNPPCLNKAQPWMKINFQVARNMLFGKLKLTGSKVDLMLMD